jgi:hypothetical protein
LLLKPCLPTPTTLEFLHPYTVLFNTYIHPSIPLTNMPQQPSTPKPEDPASQAPLEKRTSDLAQRAWETGDGLPKRNLFPEQDAKIVERCQEDEEYVAKKVKERLEKYSEVGG